MKAYLADTNVLIDALNGQRGQKELLASLVSQGDSLACCAVTISELFSGIRAADLSTVEKFLSVLRWQPTTPAIARRAGRWRYDFARQGLTLSLADTLIAATAVEYGLVLITNNQKHFPMPELVVLPGA